LFKNIGAGVERFTDVARVKKAILQKRRTIGSDSSQRAVSRQSFGIQTCSPIILTGSNVIFRDSFSLPREIGVQSRAKDETSLSQLRCSRPLLNTDLKDSLEASDITLTSEQSKFLTAEFQYQIG
jgi:hypothetical protein